MNTLVIDLNQINFRNRDTVDFIFKQVYDQKIKKLEINYFSNDESDYESDDESFEFLDFDLSHFEDIVELKISLNKFNIKPEKLPKNLESLTLENVSFPKYISSDFSSRFPEKLRTLIIIAPNSVESLKDIIPASITDLEILSFDSDDGIEVSDLSEGLVSLSFSSCSAIKNVKNLPESLRTLEFFICSELISIPTELPPNLTTLNIIRNRYLLINWKPFELPRSLTSFTLLSAETRNIDYWKENITKLVKNLPSLQNLSIGILNLETTLELRDEMTSLAIEDCGVNVLKFLPSRLEKLSLGSIFESLPQIPESIKFLSSHGDNLKLITSSLPSLDKLEISNTLDPNSLKFITHDLKELSLKSLDNQDLSELQFPNNLIALEIYDCKLLKKLPTLSHKLKDVVFSECDSLELPTSFPSEMSSFKISLCSSITSISDLSSIKIDYFEISECDKLQSIEAFPRAEIICIDDCIIKTTPNIQANTTELKITNCENLTSIGSFSENLSSLILSNLPSLESIPSLEQTNIIHLKIALGSWGNDGYNDNLQSIESFPKSLKTLEIISSKMSERLPEFPRGLFSLDLNLKSSYLPDLPDGLINLSLVNFTNLLNFNNIPKNLKSLKIHNCKFQDHPISLQFDNLLSLSISNVTNFNYDSLKNLPKNLVSLELFDCDDIEFFSSFPSSLNKLKLDKLKKLKLIPDLNSCNLEILEINHCPLESISSFPEVLQEIKLSNCSQFKTFPSFPLKLKVFSIFDCPKLEHLPPFNIEGNMENIDISNCNQLKSLPNLPSRLGKLSIYKCDQITSIDLSNSIELQKIKISYCEGLESILNFPQKVKRVDIVDCINLKILQTSFPDSLESLNLNRCQNLQTLPLLPDSLKFLYLNNCQNLQTLPPLPDKLEFLDLTGCTNLIPSEELIERLAALNDCDIRYPENFFDKYIEPFKYRITQIIDKFKSHKDNPPITDSFINLYTRYVTEGVRDRVEMSDGILEKIKKIAHSTKPLLEFIEKNPQHLTWIDEICKNYLDGCVNQPVAGIVEINAFRFIAQEDNMQDKVNAAQYLYALENIKQIVKKIPPQRAGIEIEAGNIALIFLHKILKNEGIIEKEWPSVPEAIAYAHTVEEWIERIDVKSELIELKDKIKQLESHNYIDFLCDGPFIDTWTNIEFSKHPEIIKIKGDIDNKFEAGEIEAKDIIVHRNAQIFTKVKELTIRSVKQEIEKRKVINPTLSSKLNHHMNEFKRSIDNDSTSLVDNLKDSENNTIMLDDNEKNYRQQLKKELKNFFAQLKFYNDQTCFFHSLNQHEMITEIKKGAIENCSLSLEQFVQFIDHKNIKKISDKESQDLILLIDQLANDILIEKKSSDNKSDSQFSEDSVKSDAYNLVENICQKLCIDSPAKDDSLIKKIASKCVKSLTMPQKKPLSPRGEEFSISKKSRR